MQQSPNHSNTIVSQTALDAVIRDIRNGESYPDFFDHRYDDDELDNNDQTSVGQKSEQEPGREVCK